MTKRLEEVFNFAEPTEIDAEAVPTDSSVAAEASVVSIQASSDKVDLALSQVSGLNEHESDMNDIAKTAMDAYKDLWDISQNIHDAHVGKVLEVAQGMLKTALEAQEAKSQRKLKMVELQIKKARLDWEMTTKGKSADNGPDGVFFDRNELIATLLQNRKSENPSDK